jgi:uncharacterized protein YwgA
MNDQQRQWFRLGLLAELVEKAPSKLGRTAAMKLAFFLQVAKGVPLGYNFRLYTYGPFDSEVLHDLGQAEALKAVESNVISYPSGYGYELTAGPAIAVVKDKARSELAKFQGDIDWVLAKFGGRSATELELLSTIVYADRDALRQEHPISFGELRRQVKDVKPHFADDHIMQKIESLSSDGLLRASKPSH